MRRRKSSSPDTRSKRRGDPRSLLAEHFNISRFSAVVGLERQVRVTRDNVNVQVENGLARRRAIVLRHDNAIRVQRLDDGGGQLLYRSEKRAQLLRREIGQVARGDVLRDDEAVALALREDIHEGEDIVVLEDLHARRFAAQDFREDVRAVVFAHKGLHQAVSDYLDREREAVEEGIDELNAYSPFRKGAHPAEHDEESF